MYAPVKRSVVFLLSAFCLAAGGPSMDRDGDGLYSLEELREEYPLLNEETFASLDLNDDGSVSPEEFRRGLDLDMLPRFGPASIGDG